MDNIFCIGGQVRGDSFIGRKTEVKSLRNLFVDSSVKTAKSIIGLTRTGKSSFVDNAFLDIPETEKILYVNVTLGDFSYYEMWQDIMWKLKKQLQRKELLDDELEELLSNFDEEELKWVKLNHSVKDTFEYLNELEIKVILVLDEFDRASVVFKNDTKKYDMLRELLSSPKYNLFAITISRRNLNTIEGTTYQSSTLHGVLDTIYFKGFTDEDVKEYYDVLENTYDICLSADQKKEIEYYAGTSPYLLSIFGNKLVERKKAGRPIDISDVFQNDCKLINDYYRDIQRHLERDGDLKRLIPFVIGPNIGVTQNDRDELVNLGYLLLDEDRTIAVSEYFTQFLSINMLNFSIWDAIISVEKKIKQIIEREMDTLVDFYQVYGESVKDIEREIIQNTPGAQKNISMYDTFIDSTQKKFFKSCTYFDVMSLSDSLKIVANAWCVFSKYFKESEYGEWREKFDKCGNARNPVAHGHEEYITDIEKQEIDIYCKEILESINKVSADKQGVILSEEELVAKSATYNTLTEVAKNLNPGEYLFYGEETGPNKNLKGTIISEGEYKDEKGSISKAYFESISRNAGEFKNKRIVVTIRERNPQNNGFILEFVREL